MHCLVPGYGRVSLDEHGTTHYGNLIGPTYQVSHRHCEQNDLVFIPGIGYRTVTIMMRTGLFPHFRSRNMDDLPKPPALFTSLIGSFVQSMQLPGLRIPTLEEYLMEQSGLAEERRREAIMR